MADDEWDTSPDVSDAKSHYAGTGSQGVANPFIQNAAAEAAPEAKAAVPVRRANSFGRFGGGGEKCYKCGKTVYAAELRAVKDRKFHKDCFRCTKEGCSKLLTQDFCVESSSGDAYCKPHFMQLKRPAMGAAVDEVQRAALVEHMRKNGLKVADVLRLCAAIVDETERAERI